MPSRKHTRPTLRVIAQEVNLSLGATSMALRNHPRISLAVRRRVQAVAREMGYHPDPKLASLMQHLRLQSDVDYLETLAYVSTYSSYGDWNWMSHHDYYLGAAERALDLGYRVDIFHLGERGMTPSRMSKLLVARGIRGLLLGGSSTPGATLDLDWEKFIAIAFDYSLTSPTVHRMTSNYYLEMASVLRRLEAEGCTRIGLNANSSDDAKVLGLWHAAYLLFQEQQPAARRIPINTSSDGRQGIAAWAKKHRPDAIISAGCCDFPQDYRAATGKPAPEEIRYVNMNISYADSQSRGIDKLTSLVGGLACEHLIARLQRNEIGLPLHPEISAVEGKWAEDYNVWKQERQDWCKQAMVKIKGKLRRTTARAL